MRSFRPTTVLLAALVAAGCGGDGNGPSNQPPTATFAAPTCNLLVCTFSDGSTDPDGDIASLAWTFENGTPATSTDSDPVVTFSGPGTWTVTLTATDNDGDSDDFSLEVTVTDAPGNADPVADFDFVCNAQECTFTDASTDAEGPIASWSWDFDDGSALSTEQNPTHAYTNTELQTFSVTLTVTDGGGATNSITQDVAVAPPAETSCENPANPGEFVPCTLPIEANATVTITLTSRDCTAEGNTLLIAAPIQETVFDDGCSETVGTVYQINGGTAFNAGTQLEVQVISGSSDPDRIAPAIRVTGTFATGWTLEFDDGEDPTGPGEPDFNDLVLTVTATPTGP